MSEPRNPYNPYGDDKVIAACSIFGVMDTSGKRFSGEMATTAIANMHDRGNGLGGGLAAYGIYPEMADYQAFHIMYQTAEARLDVEDLLRRHFKWVHDEPVPTRKTAAITNPPLVWRYFLQADEHCPPDKSIDDYVVELVMRINTTFQDACVFSSGRDMGVFKGVGFPEEISEYFRLEEYQGYLWTAHGRFPTNSQAWWGGAHPFSLLDWTVVHNGEISSYGTNRRYLEMFGYHCTMHTDTEVLAYAVDLLLRRHQLPLEIATRVLAAPLWSDIERMAPAERDLCVALRQVYGSLLMNGPFTIIVAHQGEMIGLTDRVRLRPLTAATQGDLLFLSSEEASIRLVSPQLDRVWTPLGGEPVIGRLKSPTGTEGADANRQLVGAGA